MACQTGCDKRLRPERERGALDQSVFNDVHAHQLDAAGAIRKSSRDILVVNHDAPENLTPNEPGMKIGFRETGRCPGSDLCVSFSQQLSAKLELFGIGGVGAEPGIQVFCVVGVELTLDDDFGRGVLRHLNSNPGITLTWAVRL